MGKSNNLLASLSDLCYLSTGEAALIHAVRQGHTATAKYLLECGASPALPSDSGATALHHAAGIGAFSSFYSLSSFFLLVCRCVEGSFLILVFRMAYYIFMSSFFQTPLEHDQVSSFCGLNP